MNFEATKSNATKKHFEGKTIAIYVYVIYCHIFSEIYNPASEYFPHQDHPLISQSRYANRLIILYTF